MSGNGRPAQDPKRVYHIALARKRYALCGRRRRDFPTVSLEYFVDSVFSVDRHNERDYCSVCREKALEALPDQVEHNSEYVPTDTMVAGPGPEQGWNVERQQLWFNLAGELARVARWNRAGDIEVTTENLLLSYEWSRTAALLVNDALDGGPPCVGGVDHGSVPLLAAMLAHCPERRYGFRVAPPRPEPGSWAAVYGTSSNRAVLVADQCFTGETLLACAEHLRALHLCSVEKTCALLDNRRTADFMRMAGYEHHSVFRADNGLITFSE